MNDYSVVRNQVVWKFLVEVVKEWVGSVSYPSFRNTNTFFSFFKLEHLPKTCAEAKKDDNLGVVHGVEEAMSLAAIRTCPKCTTPYIKSDGCNMIHCSSCGAGSCFICRKLVGFDFFSKKS